MNSVEDSCLVSLIVAGTRCYELICMRIYVLGLFWKGASAFLGATN